MPMICPSMPIPASTELTKFLYTLCRICPLPPYPPLLFLWSWDHGMLLKSIAAVLKKRLPKDVGTCSSGADDDLNDRVLLRVMMWRNLSHLWQSLPVFNSQISHQTNVVFVYDSRLHRNFLRKV